LEQGPKQLAASLIPAINGTLAGGAACRHKRGAGKQPLKAPRTRSVVAHAAPGAGWPNSYASATLACIQASVQKQSGVAPRATAEVSRHELAQGLAALTKHLLVLSGRDFLAELERTGMSLTQVKALALLAEADEPMSVKALSDAIGLSLPGVSRAIEALVQRGELAREEDKRDRRCKLLSITPRGRQIYGRLLAVRLAGARTFVDELKPEEQQALALGLDAVAGRLRR
jgi:DNA-binding MarR family transcriptional regulator